MHMLAPPVLSLPQMIVLWFIVCADAQCLLLMVDYCFKDAVKFLVGRQETKNNSKPQWLIWTAYSHFEGMIL